MKGIYITVPDSEFNFYMSVIEQFKTATIVKTDDYEMNTKVLQPWQIAELNLAIQYDIENPDEGNEANKITDLLRKKLNV